MNGKIDRKIEKIQNIYDFKFKNIKEILIYERKTLKERVKNLFIYKFIMSNTLTNEMGSIFVQISEKIKSKNIQLPDITTLFPFNNKDAIVLGKIQESQIEKLDSQWAPKLIIPANNLYFTSNFFF